MAVFPQGKTKVINRARGGEGRVLRALAKNLEDDYTVWHNVPILGSGREPDFVVLHPQRGLLILEVKDWKRSTIVDANPMQVTLETQRGRISVGHPLSQARGYALDVHHLLERHPEICHPQGPHKGKVALPWGWGAVLSHIKRSEVQDDPSFDTVFDRQRVLLADDIGEDVESLAFQERLWGMFLVSWRTSLTLPQLALVRGLLFPELRVGQQTLPLEPSLSALVVRDVLHVMDLQQETVARGLGEGHRLIHGPAGSGKTMILIYRALQLQMAARPEKPILVLCYNKALADRIDYLLRLKGVSQAVQVRTFHSWALELIRTYQLAPVKTELRGDDFDALATLACDGIAAGRVPHGQYMALLIDEAHDLSDDWIAAAVKMVDPATKSLLVLYDDAQSIYQKSRRKLSFAKLGVEARGRTDILRINYRNTREVLALALDVSGPALQQKETDDAEDVPLIVPDSAGRSGPLPTFRSFESPMSEANFVAESIHEELCRGRDPADIVAVARHWTYLDGVQAALTRKGIRSIATRTVRRGQKSDPAVCLTTLHSSKGLEFPMVYLVGVDRLDSRADAWIDEMRLLYVGMTRATHALHLSAAGASLITAAIQGSLRRAEESIA